jgi:hypothetical protein
VFFVGFIGSLTVYLGKWGVSSTILFPRRSPEFLFIYAPTSFGWRQLLLADNSGLDITWYNRIGAGMVWFWITLVFLMIVGFGYSFFWTSSSMIYLLMRKKVDEMDLDEVYLEELEDDDVFGGPPTAPLMTAEAPTSTGTTQLQESLGVRQDRPAPPPEAPADPPKELPPPSVPPPDSAS